MTTHARYLCDIAELFVKPVYFSKQPWYVLSIANSTSNSKTMVQPFATCWNSFTKKQDTFYDYFCHFIPITMPVMYLVRYWSQIRYLFECQLITAEYRSNRSREPINSCRSIHCDKRPPGQLSSHETYRGAAMERRYAAVHLTSKTAIRNGSKSTHHSHEEPSWKRAQRTCLMIDSRLIETVLCNTLDGKKKEEDHPRCGLTTSPTGLEWTSWRHKDWHKTEISGKNSTDGKRERGQ